MKRNLTTGFLLLALCCVLSACWDRREVNDIAIVEATAIDKEGDRYLGTMQFPLPGQMGGAGSGGGGGGTGGSKTWYQDSSAGNSIAETIEKGQTSVSRTLNFSHRRVLLIGEQMAKQGISPLMDIVSRIPQNRLTTYIAITKGMSRDVLNTKAPIEKLPAEMARELLSQSLRKPLTIKHTVNSILSDGQDPVLPYFIPKKTNSGSQGKEQSTIKLDGLALFKRDKLVGFINGNTAKGVLLASNQAKNLLVTFKAPNGSGMISVSFAENLTEINPVVEGNNITMNVDIRAKGIVIENQSNYASVADNAAGIQRTVGETMKNMVEQSTELLQKKYHSDALGFGDIIYRDDPRYWNTIKDRWDEVYPTVKVSVTVKIDIENAGTAIEPIGKRDEELFNAR